MKIALFRKMQGIQIDQLVLLKLTIRKIWLQNKAKTNYIMIFMHLIQQHRKTFSKKVKEILIRNENPIETRG
jgi:hypothetical protein